MAVGYSNRRTAKGKGNKQPHIQTTPTPNKQISKQSSPNFFLDLEHPIITIAIIATQNLPEIPQINPQQIPVPHIVLNPPVLLVFDPSA